MRNIPCVVTALDSDGRQMHIANTMTYWGAKRLVKKIMKARPSLALRIDETWNSPMLRGVDK